jgi:hypothetical protein
VVPGGGTLTALPANRNVAFGISQNLKSIIAQSKCVLAQRERWVQLTLHLSRESMFRRGLRTQRFTATKTLRASLVFATIAVAFTTKPTLPLQQNSTSLIPHTKSAQIDPRRIGSVSLAANRPTGQF